MLLLAIDPGPFESAYCIYDGVRPVEFAKVTTNEMLLLLDSRSAVGNIVIEQVCSYGMAVGEEVFETVFQSGRFWEAFWKNTSSVESRRLSGRLPRLKVKTHLCADSRAKDANIRQALIDRFGGRSVAIGKKKSPGPLYGMAGDCWAALAVAVTWWETEMRFRLSGARLPETEEQIKAGLRSSARAGHGQPTRRNHQTSKETLCPDLQ